MTEQQIIDELDSIIAFADGLKGKAAGLRKKLTPARKKKDVVSEDEIARIFARRRKFLNKKANAAK
jgi:hypothetical protein